MLAMLLMLQSILGPGTAVEVQTDQGWVPGRVVGVSRSSGKLEYKVAHKTGNFTFENYFAAGKVRAAGGTAADGPRFTLDQKVDARDWRERWQRGTIIAVEGSPGAWRYKVRYADRSDSSVYENAVRAASGTAPAASAAAAGGGRLVPGAYACTRWAGPGKPQPPLGSITLLAGGSYRWLSNGGSGRYSYDPATGALKFLTGPIADKLPKKVEYRVNRTTSQIDLNFGYGVDWSCGHNL